MVTKVTRGGQITLDIRTREELGISVGMPIEVNRMGKLIIIELKKKEFWDNYEGGALPKNFNHVLKQMRKNSKERFRRLGIL